MTSIVQAEKLIKLARGAISAYFSGKDLKVSAALQKEFSAESGVFVSIYVGDELNGCIGFPEPIIPLWEGVVKAALGAAFEDPRFPPLQKEQLKKCRIELSVLTKPEKIEAKKVDDYFAAIEIGRDGLMIKDEFGSGLLLPQVPEEWSWDKEEFLNQTCRKAGLEPDCWRDMRKKIFKFQAQIFTERHGKVVEIKF